MAVMLDDVDALAKIDASGMLRQMTALADQLDRSLCSEVKLDHGSERLCLCGLGGSAMGADVLCDHLERTTKVMASVIRDVALPGWVDRDTLVVLISYSGNTRETLSMYGEARRRGARVAVITSGGRLQQLSEKNGDPLVAVPPGLQPRAALGHLLGAAAAVVGAAGISTMDRDLRALLPNIREELEACSPSTPQASNQAKQIAVRLHGRIPFVYSSRNVRPAGRRWQTQINENSKTLCLYGELPEADHNQVVGWVDGTRESACQPVFLRAPSDQGMMADIVNATISIFEDFRLDPIVVDLHGSSALENIMRGMILGDHVSYYLAMLKGVDPTPVSSISELKKRLG
ncbi:MAG: bifunctional phosphoglucose/phosphomannose isomerase [Methanomassiliicoccus sp.]|nr:bifunctional phosphoglucose/phosphomannose isomerase [Methanomassiliicoccus sp.]